MKNDSAKQQWQQNINVNAIKTINNFQVGKHRNTGRKDEKEMLVI